MYSASSFSTEPDFHGGGSASAARTSVPAARPRIACTSPRSAASISCSICSRAFAFGFFALVFVGFAFGFFALVFVGFAFFVAVFAFVGVFLGFLLFPRVRFVRAMRRDS